MAVLKIYDTAAEAGVAATILAGNGYAGCTHVIAEGAALPDALVAAGVPRRRIEAYAARVRAGAALVVVNPPLCTAFAAMQILDSNSGPRPVPNAVYEGDFSDDAAPLSAILGLPVLANFFVFGGLLSRGRMGNSSFGLPLLWHRFATGGLLSRGFTTGAIPLLSHRFTFGGLLSRKQTGGAKLINDPAPLSRLLGLKVLIRD